MMCLRERQFILHLNVLFTLASDRDAFKKERKEQARIIELFVVCILLFIVIIFSSSVLQVFVEPSSLTLYPILGRIPEEPLGT